LLAVNKHIGMNLVYGDSRLLRHDTLKNWKTGTNRHGVETHTTEILIHSPVKITHFASIQQFILGYKHSSNVGNKKC
jgi:hypothetical protein